MKNLLGTLGLLLCFSLQAQIYDTNNPVVQVFAGSGSYGFLDAQGTQALFRDPAAVTSDTASNLYVLDLNNYRIRKISPNGTVSTFVGGGTGALPGYGTTVSLANYTFGYSSMAIDSDGTLSIVVQGGLLRITSDAYAQYLSYSGIVQASGICVDSGNNVYYTTYSGNKVYRLGYNGTLTLFAGNGSAGSANGNGINASFRNPTALACDAADNIYVWDSGNYLIRRINQNGDVTTIAGTGASSNVDGIGTNAAFNSISSMCSDGLGNIYMACGSCIRRISASTNVTTVAGSFSQNSYANGAGGLARFSGANGICRSQGMLFVADQSNQRIRQISFNPTAQQVSPANLSVRMLPGLSITGFVGRTYRVESSLNMSTWGTEATILLTSSPYQWIDQNSLGQKKFYRAFLLP